MGKQQRLCGVAVHHAAALKVADPAGIQRDAGDGQGGCGRRGQRSGHKPAGASAASRPRNEAKEMRGAWRVSYDKNVRMGVEYTADWVITCLRRQLEPPVRPCLRKK